MTGSRRAEADNLVPPSVARPCAAIDRPALLERLMAEAERRVILIEAPAGFGKSTMMSALSHSFVAAGEEAARWRAGSMPLRDWLPPTGSACVQRRLMLDDIHRLTEADRATLAECLLDASDLTRFVLAGRAVPEIGLSRLTCAGVVARFGASSLRFSPAEEATALAAMAKGFALDGEALNAKELDGWPAGVGLLVAAARYTRDGVDACPFRDYFQSEILTQIPDDLCTFLIRISILDQLNARSAEAVSGMPDSLRLLNAAIEGGLFVEPIAKRQGEYRLAIRFRTALRDMLARGGGKELSEFHTRAAHWCESEERIVPALDHYRAAGQEAARAALLEARAEALIHDGRMRVVEDHAADLPADLLAGSPGLLLVLAWLKTRGSRLEEARWLLDRAAEAIERGVRAGDLEGVALDRLRWLSLHREMTLAAAEGKAASVDEQCERLMKWVVPTEPYLSASLHGQMIEAQRSLFQFGETDRLALIARDHAARSGNPVATIVLDTRLGRSLHMAGRTERAEAALRRALDQAGGFAGIGSSLAAMAGLPLAALLRDMGDYPGARKLVDAYLPVAHCFCVPEQMMDGYAVRASLAASEDDTTSAFQAIADGLTIASEGQLSVLRLGLVSEKVRLLIRLGQPDTARDAAAEVGIRMHRSAPIPSANASVASETEATIWALVAMGGHRISEALNVARSWGDFCARRGAIPKAIAWRLLKSELLHLRGEAAAATRALRDAVRLAAPAGLVHPFRNADRLIHQMIVDVYEGDASLHPPEADFVAGLLAEMRATLGKVPLTSTENSCGALYGKLNDRERQILTLAASSMRNREIGQTLGLTEGTVKWYMCQIYDKTGTRRRMEAIARARQLALID